jgi:hypothetical protein
MTEKAISTKLSEENTKTKMASEQIMKDKLYLIIYMFYLFNKLNTCEYSLHSEKQKSFV